MASGHGANRKYKPRNYSYEAVDNPVVDAWYFWTDRKEWNKRRRETNRKLKQGKQDSFAKGWNSISEYGLKATPWVAPTTALDPTNNASMGERALDLALTLPMLKPLKTLKVGKSAVKNISNYSMKVAEKTSPAVKAIKNSKYTNQAVKKIKEVANTGANKTTEKILQAKGFSKQATQKYGKKLSEFISKKAGSYKKAKEIKKLEKGAKQLKKGKKSSLIGKTTKYGILGGIGYGLYSGISGLFNGAVDVLGGKSGTFGYPQGASGAGGNGGFGGFGSSGNSANFGMGAVGGYVGSRYGFKQNMRFTDKKPLTALKTNALEVGNQAKLIGSCCTNDPQEKIKIHAFRDKVEHSLEIIAKSEKSEAESLKKATKKKQNDPRFKRLTSSVMGAVKSLEKQISLKNMAKAVGIGIMGLLGGWGVLWLVGFVKRMGGWFGLKKWLTDSIMSKVESMMDALKQWWEDNVIPIVWLVLEQLAVVMESLGIDTTTIRTAQKNLNNPTASGGGGGSQPSTVQPTQTPSGVTPAPKPSGGGSGGSGKSPSKTPMIKVPTGNSAPISGKIGRVTSGYGERNIHGKKEFHHGIDLSAPIGTPVQSIDYGIVVVADTNPGGREGKYVSIYNPRTKKRVSYMHLSKISPAVLKAYKNKTVIKAGEVIGWSGATGTRVTGPHIHIQVKSGKTGGKFMNPQAYVDEVAPYNTEHPNEAYSQAHPGSSPIQANKAPKKINPAPTGQHSAFISKEEFELYKKSQDGINKHIMNVAVTAGTQETKSLKHTFTA